MKDALTVYNERVKLFAGFINAIAIGLIGLAVLRPITDGAPVLATDVVWWFGLDLAGHACAHYVLGRLRKESG